jgi:chorismate dehydratase
MLRFGCHNFINSLPILYGLKRKPAECFLTLDNPRVIARLLREGSLDIAIVPAIEYLLNADYLVVPDVCIAAKGPVASVNLYHRKPPEEIRHIALDSSSLTSVVLIKIIMEKCFKVRPAYSSANMTRMEDVARAKADAVLVIGDEALNPPPAGYGVLDLAEQWRRMTNLPFVFAMCCTRRGTDLGGFEETLRASLAEGLAHVTEIAAEAAAQSALPAERVKSYLTQNLRYVTGKEEREGLKRFYAEAVAARLCPKEREFEFYPG